MIWLGVIGAALAGAIVNGLRHPRCRYCDRPLRLPIDNFGACSYDEGCEGGTYFGGVTYKAWNR